MIAAFINLCIDSSLNPFPPCMCQSEQLYPHPPCSLTLGSGLGCGFKVLHGAEQAALEHTSAAALSHDAHTALLAQLGGRAAPPVVPTGLAKRPATLGLSAQLLCPRHQLTAGLRRL